MKKTKSPQETGSLSKPGFAGDIVAVAGIAVSLLFLIALLTYSSTDNSWLAYSTNMTTANAAGTFGAKFAGFSLWLFGVMSYMLPVFIGLLSWTYFYNREKGLKFDLLALRIIGFILMITGGCAIFSLTEPDSFQWMPAQAGGVIGAVFGGSRVIFGAFGANIIFLLCFLLGFTFAANISWFRVADFLGAAVIYGWAKFVVLLERVSALLRVGRAKKERLLREKEILAERKKIRNRKPEIRPEAPPVKPSKRLEREKQKDLLVEHMADPNPLIRDTRKLPPLSLLNPAVKSGKEYSPETLEALSRLVELKLRDFKVEVEVVAVEPGPVVTRFELMPAPGVKASKITGLSTDLARSLSQISVRVVEVIPGKAVIGLEIPNEYRETVFLSEIVGSDEYERSRSPLTMALGKNIAGHPGIADLAKMPHLLVAGTTGSGKSVCINTIILSILYKSYPDEIRFIMIDPKMLELSVYEGIPHLLAPVVTDMNDAANALRWSVVEMERRYKLMSELGVRNINGFNHKIRQAEKHGVPLSDPFVPPGEEPQKLEKLPFIVVVIDEFADMIMVVGKKVEELIVRLAQKARASGIHLVLATQRPSVDVITGLIKSNVPSRIAFQVSSKMDSRVILDQMGAENLLGKGDMLFMPAGQGIAERFHGAFVADNEVHRVVEYLKQHYETNYLEGVLSAYDESSDPMIIPGVKGAGVNAKDGGEKDVLFDEAVQVVMETRKASISGVQRRLRIGYNRAARLIEAMEEAGLVSPMGTNGQREIIVPQPEN